MKISKLTKTAWFLLSGLLSPSVIALGAFIGDHRHPYVGGAVIAYGVIWGWL